MLAVLMLLLLLLVLTGAWLVQLHVASRLRDSEVQPYQISIWCTRSRSTQLVLVLDLDLLDLDLIQLCIL